MWKLSIEARKAVLVTCLTTFLYFGKTSSIIFRFGARRSTDVLKEEIDDEHEKVQSNQSMMSFDKYHRMNAYCICTADVVTVDGQ